MKQSPKYYRKKSPRKNHGYVYIAVLFTALIVGASVATALSLSTSNLQSEHDRINRMRALRLAESEIHRIAAEMNVDASWRTSQTSGVFDTWKSINHSDDNALDSQVRFMLTDDDNDLSDDNADSVMITTHAKVGESEYALAARVEPRLGADEILLFGITTSDDIQIELDGKLSCESKVQIGDDCLTNSSGMITAPQIALTKTATLSLRGDTALANVVMPTHDVVDQYVQKGTQISVWNLPIQDSKRVISDRAISATLSSFGSANSDGIYWIDAASQVLQINNCHIRATLAIKNATRIEIAGGIVWTFPAEPDMFLVTDSPIEFIGLESSLSEADRSINFNPVHTPHRGTESDSDRTDIFPTEFRGVLYSTADIQIHPFVGGGTIPFTGNLICSDLEILGASVAVRHLTNFADASPLGLIDTVPLQFVRGSFHRVPSP